MFRLIIEHLLDLLKSNKKNAIYIYNYNQLSPVELRTLKTKRR
jgi:hypothetical protein